MTKEDHPTGRKLGWRITASELVFENKLLRLRHDKIALPRGEETGYAYVEKGASVLIVPVTSDGRMVLVRQYRYPVDVHCLEVPAGTASDSEGLTLEELAAKELKEEVGATFSHMEKIGSFFSNSSLTDEECHVFIASGVELADTPQKEASEEMETVVVPIEEAVAMARSGEMKTAPLALAVLMAEPHLRGLGLM